MTDQVTHEKKLIYMYGKYAAIQLDSRETEQWFLLIPRSIRVGGEKKKGEEEKNSKKMGV